MVAWQAPDVTPLQQRFAAVVADANPIGTTYMRAQTLREPIRTPSLEALRRYTDEVIAYSNAVPGPAAPSVSRAPAKR